MADSVRELIMKELQSTLEGIKVANGYSLTLTSVERQLQRGQSFNPPQAYIFERDDRPIDSTQQDAGGVATERAMEVGVGLVVQQDEETDARSASEDMNAVLADVQRVMQIDVQRGGHAINTEEIGITEIEIVEGQPALVASIAYEIRYRHLRTDPRVEV